MAMLKGINLTIAFLLELCMLVVFGLWGIQASQSLFLRIILGIGLPLGAAVFWGLFMAPKSGRRLTGLAYWLVEFVLYGLVTLALASTGQTTPALVFAVVAILNAALIILWKQDQALAA
jgi:hypothetical protein